MKIQNINAKSIAQKEFFSVSLKDNVREVLNKIREENVFAAPVLEDGEFEGIITWREILQRSVPPDTKVERLILHPPRIEADINVVEVADTMLETGSRAAPVFDMEDLIGIITQKEIIKAVAKDESFRREKISDLLFEVVTIKKDGTIGRARALMREHRVARVPVTDKDGDLVGSIDVSGVVKTFHPEKALQVGDRKGDVIPERDSPVTTIMNSNPIKITKDSNLKDAAKKMARNDSLYAIVVEENKPVGILTPKDVMEIVASRKSEKEAYIQIAGAEELDAFEKDKILDVAERTVRKAGRMFNNVENLIVHIKEQNTEGGKTQYYVRARIFTSKGLYTARQDWDWNLIDAVDSCLDKLEKRFTKDHEKKVDRHRKKK
jgi:CBS domain-containing protein/ribosome-associated translation inhibitor RaiA